MVNGFKEKYMSNTKIETCLGEDGLIHQTTTGAEFALCGAKKSGIFLSKRLYGRTFTICPRCQQEFKIKEKETC
jgi:hypothetical protein